MTGFFVFLLVVLLLAFGALLAWQDYLRWRSPHVRTVGTVAGHSKSEMDDATHYSAIISFTDQSGERHEFTDPLGWAVPKREAGSQIGIVYPEGQPERARVPRPYLRVVAHALLFGAAFLMIAGQAGLAD